MRHDLLPISAAIRGHDRTVNPSLEETMSIPAGATPGQQKEQTATDRRQHDGQPAGQTSNLAVRYGAIGIPAVAAALRYTVVIKNPAYAPVVHQFDPRLAAELAA
jgi:hypothetical protein